MFRSVLARVASSRLTAVQPLCRRWYQAGPNSVRMGNVIDIKGEPQIVVSRDHGGTARGQAVIKLNLKHAVTGIKSTERFRNNDTLEVLLLVQNQYQYLYSDGDTAHLLNMQTYEELTMDINTLEGGKDKLPYLEDNMEVTVQSLEPEPGPLSWRLPARHTYKVKSLVDRIAKDRGTTYVTGTLENGMQVQIPNFIKPGENVVVDLTRLTYIAVVCFGICLAAHVWQWVRHRCHALMPMFFFLILRVVGWLLAFIGAIKNDRLLNKRGYIINSLAFWLMLLSGMLLLARWEATRRNVRWSLRSWGGTGGALILCVVFGALDAAGQITWLNNPEDTASIVMKIAAVGFLALSVIYAFVSLFFNYRESSIYQQPTVRWAFVLSAGLLVVRCVFWMLVALNIVKFEESKR
ncbi:hypothetical protein IWW35_002445, partial [Coemansia sp. RSA 1878]